MRTLTHLAAIVGLGALLVGCSDPEKAKREHFDSANKFLEAGKAQEAIVEYRNALKEDGKFGEARLKLAEAYQAVGNINQAFRESVRAADLLPNDNTAQIRAANYLMLGGRFEDAKTRIQPVVDRDPTNVEAQLILGNALVGLKDLDGAIREIEEAIKLDPGRAQTYSNLAAVKAQQGDKDQARAAFEKAVEVDPKSIVARLALAYFRWTEGDAAGAEESLKAAVAADPKNRQANRTLAAFYLGTRRAPLAEPYSEALAASGAADSALQLADYYLAQRRTADATAVLQPLTKTPATSAAAETRLAAIAYVGNDKAKGHQMIDAVLAREPANVQALLVKAQWLLVEGKSKEALERAQAAVKADPRDLSSQYYLGVAHDRLRQSKEAMAAFNEVLRLNPRAVAAQVQLSRLNLIAGSTDNAITFAEGALSSAPSNPEARVNLVRGLLGRRDTARAEQELAPLLKTYPKVSVVHSLNGAVKLQKKDVAGARADFQRALELAPKSVEALNGLTTLDLLEKRLPQARERVESHLSADPNNMDLLLLAAKVYTAQREFATAEATLRKAIQRDPSSSPAYSMLANVLLASGKLDQARVEFDQMVAREPNNLAAQTMAAMIVHSQAGTTEAKRADAKKRYEAILNANPTAAVAANNLAWMSQEENQRLDEALRLAQSAAVRLKDSGEVMDTIGMIYVKKALPSLAVNAFEKSLEKSPDNASYHLHLAMALKEAGDAKRARQAAEQAIKLRPGYAEAQKLLDSTKG